MRALGLTAAFLTAAVIATTPAAAQSAPSAPAPGQIINAALETKRAADTLDRELDAARRRGTVWVGYSVPSIGGRHQTCVPFGADGVARVMLEPPKEFSILIRLEAGTLSKIRTSTPECVIDAGGLPVIWLNGVRAEDSVRWFVSTIGTVASQPNDRDRGLLDSALSALAWHAGDDATKAVVSLAKNDARPAVRSRSLFWLSQRASAETIATIRDAVNGDPEVEVKKKAVFALSQLPANQGVPLLIEVARTHPNREVRRQAMTWLGQSKDPRAVSFFEDVLKKP